MTAPTIIQSLVNRFRDSRELYRSGRYNEAQLRQEFLNPLFEALGWDMVNRSNLAPQKSSQRQETDFARSKATWQFTFHCIRNYINLRLQFWNTTTCQWGK